MYNYLDPDQLVFNNVTEGANRARLLGGIVTGTLITGDDFSNASASLVDRAKRILQNQNLLDISRGSNGKAFRPVEGNTGNGTTSFFVKQVGKYYYLAVFNFGSKEQSYDLPLDSIGLVNLNYSALELYSNETVEVHQNLSLNLPEADAAVFR